MNRFQITADIDVALLLGALTEHQYRQSNIEYAKLEELFESEHIYFPSRYELDIEQMFDSCTFDVWKTSYTQDVEVDSDGIATIYMNSNVWFDGVNLSLPRDEIVAELKQRIDNRHSGDLVGIGNALTEVVVDVHID